MENVFPKKVRKSISQKGDSDTVTALLFTAPFLLLWIAWFFYPFMQSFLLSFQDFDFINPGAAKFIGLGNYIKLFSDNPEFLQAIYHSILIVVVAVPVQTILALIIAMALNTKIHGRAFFRTIYVIPNITSGIAAATIFMILFRQDYPVTKILSIIFRLPGETWIASAKLALPFIIILYIWQQVGFYMIIYLAGLQDVPQELYEACTVDGANALQQFIHVTVPMLRPVTFFIVSVGTINAFQVFDQVAAISRYGVLGSPAGATSTLITYFYQHGIRYTADMGLGCASVIVFLMIILAVTYLQKKFLDDKEGAR
jgi:multiple sugar transport system permease protein